MRGFGGEAPKVLLEKLEKQHHLAVEVMHRQPRVITSLVER